MSNNSAARSAYNDVATHVAEAKKICLVSLGCPKNLVDAEMMLGFLQKDGFQFSTKPEESDVIVVNTCGFVEDSKTESIEHLIEMSRYKEDGNCQVLVASGCLPQRYSEELAHELPEVDLFAGTGEFDKISGLLKKRFQTAEVSKQKNTKTSKAQKEKKITFPKALISRDQILPDPDLPRVLAIEHSVHVAPWSQGNFKGEMDKPYSQVWVLTDDETDSEIFGYVVFWEMGESFEILNIAVSLSARGLGYAQKMLQQVVRGALAKNAKRLILDVRKSNLPAIALYQKVGFTITQLRKGFYSNGEDAYSMNLELSGEKIEF